MTDFLSRLVERSFGATPAIRPRVAFLFEPILGSGEPATAGLREHSVADAPEPDLTPRLSGRRDEPPDAASFEPRLEFEERTTGAPAVLPLRLDLPPAPTGPQFALQVTPPTVSEHSEDRRRAPSSRGSEPDWAADVRPVVTPSSVTPSVADPHAGPDRIAVRWSAAEREQPSLVVPSRIATRIAADLRSSVPAANATSRDRDAGPPLAALNHHAQVEPNVQVTIGRIEVRAPARDKAPSRERSASPVMGLDEYLRRQVRRGGQ
jgi:hypothetical protein